MSKTETTHTTTTTTPPKADANPFAAFGAFDPAGAWQKMFADAQARAHAFADEYAAMEAQMYARAKQAIEAWAQLAQDALAYSAQLSAQARKLGLETARKMSV